MKHSVSIVRTHAYRNRVECLIFPPRSADPRVVCYHRDASASCLHVQHGENATKSVALESAGPDFLAASPLAAVVDAGFFAPRASDGDAAGLFVFDAARAATAGDDDQLRGLLLHFINSDAGHAEDRGAKLGI